MENSANTLKNQIAYSNGTAGDTVINTAPVAGVSGFSNGTTFSIVPRTAPDTDSVSTTCPLEPPVDSKLFEALPSEPQMLELHPAQDHADGVSYFAVNHGKKNFLLTSNRRVIPFDDLSSHGIKLKHNLVDSFGFSVEGIRDYLSGRSVVDPENVYNELLSYTGNYIFFKESEAHVITVLYTIGTYFHCLFPSIGYLHFRGEMGSGKTRSCSVLTPVVFNGEASVSLRPEIFCYSINTNRSTLLWDEAQYLGRTGFSRNNTTLSILKSGIYPDGGVKMLHRGATFAFSTFGPKIFAGTRHLDPELEDRVIEIISLKNLPNEHVARYVQNPALRKHQQQLRDLLYTLALRYGRVVAEMRDGCAEEVGRFGLEDRAFDIYYPMFLLAMFIDSCSGAGWMTITDSVLAFVERSKERKRRREIFDNVIVQLMTMVRDYLMENYQTPKSNDQIIIPTDALYTFAKDREYIPAQRTKSWLTRQLNDIGIVNHTAKIDSKSRRVYVVEMPEFEDRCRRSLAPDVKV